MAHLDTMTLREAKAIVRQYGFTLTCKRDYGEFRLAPIAGTPARKEAESYYTSDLRDAIGTARLVFRTGGM